jgi:hypothetical protein
MNFKYHTFTIFSRERERDNFVITIVDIAAKSQTLIGLLNPTFGRWGNHLRPTTALDMGAYNFIKRTQNRSVIQVWPFCVH